MAADHKTLADAGERDPAHGWAVSALRASWPALDERRLRGWSLGFSEGFTRRANSVWMLGEVGDESDVRAAIGTVEEAYRVRGLPSRFLTTDSSDPSEVAALKAFGYLSSLSGRILMRALDAPPAAAPGAEAAGASVPDDVVAPGVAVLSTTARDVPSEWLDAWLEWNGRRLARDRRVAPRILAANEAVFLEVRVEGRLVALARVAVTDGTGVIDCLATESSSQGRGYGRLLLERAAGEAAARGAASCLAMVVDSNAVSLRLFERAGFRQLGAFRYLEAPERVSCC
ncbi:hypothetical protein C5B85_03580 [Pseudoclavibacter sp. AY1F1]|uniref:GNAT family N-acetyltransferase n=1 Tax=Pseudoclavibacter sp. AY1F1 TaxID=2080583 RepID=UPI000CE8DC96|nr:GNAT family N-acetyltransferase [Pseudoclavibacter sp. AY1F1]PPF47348.1 hypothetical protein C5B85_03580 [Pseudoclavibacter sp. AY1F1]